MALRKWKGTACTALLCLIPALGGCGGPVRSISLKAPSAPTISGPTTKATTSTATTSLASPSYVGRIKRATSYGESGISLDVPPPSSQPSVSWESAFQKSCATSATGCDQGGPITISLAAATEKQAGQENPDGSIHPVMDNTLVYVISQSGNSCRPVGPAGKTTTSPVTYACTSLNFVDAQTGKVLYSVQSPGL
jgi:hypothetical protein